MTNNELDKLPVELGPVLLVPEEDSLHSELTELLDQGPELLLIGLPIGPCGGVRMADEALTAVIDTHANKRVLANHEHVHNPDMTGPHEKRGVRFGAAVEEITFDDVYFLSAHGSDPDVRKKAEELGALVYDSICPLVFHTHQEIRNAAKKGYAVGYLSFGKPTHPEVQAAGGVAREAGTSLFVISDINSAELAVTKARENDYEGLQLVGQTTNNSDQAELLAVEITYHFNQDCQDDFVVEHYNFRDVCKTVRDRQQSVIELVGSDLDTLVVLGSVTSKNTHSLIEVAVDVHNSIISPRPLTIIQTNSWTGLTPYNEHLQNRVVGIVSGASAPDANVEGVLGYLNPRSHDYRGQDSDRDRVFHPIDGSLNTVFINNRKTKLG